MFHIIGAMAEFERDVISEHIQAGLEVVRAHGKELYVAKQNTIAEIMHMTELKSRNTFYKICRQCQKIVMMHLRKAG